MVEGVGGDVRVGYRVVATLGAFRVDVLDDAMPTRVSLDATIVSSDPFWITRRPMTCTVTVGGSVLRWTDVDPTIQAGSLRVTTIDTPTDR